MELKPVDYSPPPPEQGIVAQSSYTELETLNTAVAKIRENSAARHERKADKLERYRAVGSEVLALAGITPPEEVVKPQSSRKPGFIQRRRETRWAKHAEKRLNNSYTKSNHSAYGGTWQGDLMKVSAAFTRFKSKRKESRRYKDGDISALELRKAKHEINARRSYDLVSDGANRRLEAASSLFSGDTLLRARTRGFFKEAREQRLRKKANRSFDKSTEARNRAIGYRQEKLRVKQLREEWAERKRDGIV